MASVPPEPGAPGAAPAPGRTAAASVHTGSAVATQTESALAPLDARVRRFGRTERAVHWVHATGFLVLLLSGLFLLFPAFAGLIGTRPLWKGVHLAAGILWPAGLLIVWLLGDRRALGGTWRQFEAMNRTDLRWLRSAAARAEPQRRFNGGQQLHALVQAALLPLFVISGALLWLGERDHSLRVAGALPLHDTAMVVGLAFAAGHIWFATSDAGRPALRSLVDGTVPASYAREHHADWDPARAASRPSGAVRSPIGDRAAAALVLGAAALAVWLLVGT